jgi:hypothetical protein
MAFKRTGETDEESAARLAKSPEGSRSHDLSKLPILQRGYLRGRVLALPLSSYVVVPYEYRGHGWACIVLNEESHDLFVSEDELRRAATVRLFEGEVKGKITDVVDTLNKKANLPIFVATGNDKRLAFAEAAHMVEVAAR